MASTHTSLDQFYWCQFMVAIHRLQAMDSKTQTFANTQIEYLTRLEQVAFVRFQQWTANTRIR